MMQARDARRAHYSGRVGRSRFETTPRGPLLVQGIMNAILVAVPYVFPNQPPQVGLAQRDHVIQ